MTKSLLTALLLLAAAVLAPTAWAQDNGGVDDIETEKLGQTGFKFLQVNTDPRSAALAGALTSVSMNSSVALFANPATMAEMGGNLHATAGQTQFIADINYNMASVAFAPAAGRYGVFGLSLISVDYGDFIGTVADNSVEAGYRDFSYFGLDEPSVTAMAVGVGYAKALSDRFSVGAQVKYAHQDLGSAPEQTENGQPQMESFSAGTAAVDFGVLYKTGFRSLNFAMSARNFAQEVTYVTDNFELPLTFRIGVSMDLMDLAANTSNMHSLLFSVDAERPRDFAEHFRVGAEYTFMETISLRAGYQFPADERTVSLGAGVHQDFSGVRIGADYAYTAFGVFGNVNQLSLQFGF